MEIRTKMKWISFILVLVSFICTAQSDRLSLFNNERTMDRRFTLYQGQIRVQASYDYVTFRSEFDEDGTDIRLSQSGISMNMHGIRAGFRYGIIDFLDAEVRLSHKKRNYRGEPLLIIGAPEPPINVYSDIVTSGLEDVFLGINARFPNKGYAFDASVSGGVYLPTSENQPDKPGHTYDFDGNSEIINYNHSENWGYGVMSFDYGGFFKYRLSNLAFSASFSSRIPQGVSENLEYSWRLSSDGVFEYSNSTYDYQVPQTLQVDILGEYQLYDWINVFTAIHEDRSFRGWRQEGDLKVKVPDQRLMLVNPGFEVLVSNKLWLRQGARFPIAGENAYSSFSFYLTFYYNILTQ